MAMYLSWPVIVLAAIGAALLLTRLVRRRDPRLAAFVLSVGCVSALYLNQTYIFPDQIWAMRRFLPVVFPGLIIASVYPLTRLTRFAGLARFRTQTKVVTTVLALVIVMSPMVVWGRSHLWAVANGEVQIAEVNTACGVVGNHPVILAGGPAAAAIFLPTFKVNCGSEVLSYAHPTTEGLATLKRNMTDPANGADTTEPIVAVFDPKSVSWQGATPAPYITSKLTAWGQPLQAIPSKATHGTRSMWFGTLTADGKIVPIGNGSTIINGP